MQNKKEVKKVVKQKRQTLALAQILILMLGIIAIGYALGSGVREVSAQTGTYGEQEYEFGDERGIEDDTTSSTNNEEEQKETEEKEGKYILPNVAGWVGGLAKKLWKWITGSGKEVAKDAAEKSFLSKVARDAGIAVGLYYGIKFIFPKLGISDEYATALANAAAWGYGSGSLAANLGIGEKTFILGVPLPWAIGIGVGLYVFLKTFKKEELKTYTFSCDAWQAPSKGEYCDRCNEGELPCSEYQCKSLGQACEIFNQGTSEEKCAWKSRNDIDPPVVQPWEGILKDDFSYRPDSAINPPDRGVFIKYKGGCIPAFTPFKFGVLTNELTMCKIDVERKTSFDEMPNFMGGSSTLKYNHSQSMTLPSKEALESENITLKDGGNFEVYVRCKDVNDNPEPSSPSASFVFKYCIDEGPDTEAPKIMGTSIPSDSPIAYNQSSVYLELYVNEPAECKWSRDHDKVFDQMEGNMSCSHSIFELNAQMLYKCSTTLSSLKSREENKFYFRCKDKPWQTEDRYENQKGYLFVLVGTQPLIIDSYGPNGTIKDSTDPAKVTLTAETSAGYNEGEATCYYSSSCYNEKGSKEPKTMFYYADGTSSYTHSQDIWPGQGTYNCVIRCIDLGGNMDEVEFSYNVELDLSAPEVVRVYRDGGNLKIILNEEGACVYSFQDCNYLFSDGNAMNTIDDTEHFTAWKSDKTYYIRCKDTYENQISSNSCSIVVRPFDVYTIE